ncbi:hypothetical protein PRIPAC_88506 [Pristionchus pacificus]|uniref:Uncharacterized protein n=1 Tax=Pristionchus pacificus TaxID=54126 RepID=A0A2A6CXK1_PRIPA|nr:hypothetical protein PRIPAC_88506 [Pristionchus pacificus]|eukprot:PDM82751.1 hypothetical protein PRIPAC_37144 [Pristionchus pacificus]
MLSSLISIMFFPVHARMLYIVYMDKSPGPKIKDSAETRAKTSKTKDERSPQSSSDNVLEDNLFVNYNSTNYCTSEPNCLINRQSSVDAA